MSSSKKVVEYTVVLLNILATERSGTLYLLNEETVIYSLVKILNLETNDTNLRQSALGALQKFSLRRTAQSVMIDLDVIKWIVTILRNEINTISDYTLHYATALLMNLSLRSAGKDKIEDPKLQVLKVLNSLLEHDNPHVRTYINGTLYSIIQRSSLKEEARAVGLPEELEELKHLSDEQYQKQIQYILDRLNSETEEDAMSDPSDDEYYDPEELGDDEEDELLTEDEDEEENLEGPGLRVGEELLVSEFLAPTSEAIHQTITITEKIEQEDNEKRNLSYTNKSGIFDNDDKPMMRPVTPNVNRDIIHDRVLPPELKSRPKIPRTPASHQMSGESSPHFQKDTQGEMKKHEASKFRDAHTGAMVVAQPIMENVEEDKEDYKEEYKDELPEAKKTPKIEKNEKVNKSLSETGEYKVAFISKSKIPRTPPEEQKTRPKKKTFEEPTSPPVPLSSKIPSTKKLPPSSSNIPPKKPTNSSSLKKNSSIQKIKK